jgi:hypothetical protein
LQHRAVNDCIARGNRRWRVPRRHVQPRGILRPHPAPEPRSKEFDVGCRDEQCRKKRLSRAAEQNVSKERQPDESVNVEPRRHRRKNRQAADGPEHRETESAQRKRPLVAPNETCRGQTDAEHINQTVAEGYEERDAAEAIVIPAPDERSQHLETGCNDDAKPNDRAVARTQLPRAEPQHRQRQQPEQILIGPGRSSSRIEIEAERSEGEHAREQPERRRSRCGDRCHGH